MKIEQLIKDLENLANRYPTREVEIISPSGTTRLEIRNVEICGGRCHVLVNTKRQD